MVLALVWVSIHAGRTVSRGGICFRLIYCYGLCNCYEENCDRGSRFITVISKCSRRRKRRKRRERRDTRKKRRRVWKTITTRKCEYQKETYRFLLVFEPRTRSKEGKVLLIS